MKAVRGWKRPFEDPIDLPRGRQLITLEDAASYREHVAYEQDADAARTGKPPKPLG